MDHRRERVEDGRQGIRLALISEWKPDAGRTNMKLTLQHFSIRSTNALDAWVEDRIFSLQPRLQIDEANIRLEHRREASPAYRVHVHLVTPGPAVDRKSVV